MNTSTADPLVRCYHCDDPLRDDGCSVLLDGVERAMCCAGCAAAASWIDDTGLGDYYRLRSASGSRVNTDDTDFRVWDRDDLLSEHSRSVDDHTREITLLVDGMHCAACAWLIDRALRREAGVLDVSANAVTGRVLLHWQPRKVPLSALLLHLSKLGFRPYLSSGEERERERLRQRRRMLLRIGVAGLGAMQVMMFSEALYLDTAREMPLATRDFFRWLAFLVSTPVVFYGGWPFLAGLWRDVRLRRLGMDTLVGGSILLAWSASLLATLRGAHDVWFDAAVMFVFFLLVARFAEDMTRQRAVSRVEALAKARPALALRETADGHREQVLPSDLRIGDTLWVDQDQSLPADAELLQPARLDESLLTGEATPLSKPVGARVYAGSVCRDAAIAMRVVAVGEATRLAQLMQLLQKAQAERPPLAQLANRIAHGFVITIIALATITFAVWWQLQPERAFEVALSLLVISCPCALSLAVPTALSAAQSGLSRIGVLTLTPRALESLARAQHIVFDKTGTLTSRQPTLRAATGFCGISPEQALRLATALERGSSHPLASAFNADDAPHAQALTAVAGAGVEGVIDGRTLRLGRADFASGMTDDGAIWLGDGRQPLGRFEISDTLRADAGASLSALRALGCELEILSGDAQTSVADAAAVLNVTHWRARQTPEQKLAHIRDLQAQGHHVTMVGDGINDGPVLAAADVSLAMAEGAELAHRAADVVLLGGRLQRIPQAIVLAKRCRRITRQNLLWALSYNAVGVTAAAFGWVSPGIAALGMALSSLLVTLNALRLARPLDLGDSATLASDHTIQPIPSSSPEITS